MGRRETLLKVLVGVRCDPAGRERLGAMPGLSITDLFTEDESEEFARELPADLLGDRPLDEGDLARRTAQLALYRAGEATGAARGEGESGAISSAVN